MDHMEKLVKTCKRCMNPWVLGICLVAVIGLAILIPIVGIPTLIAFLPLAACLGMCAAMPFMMRGKDNDKH